MPKAPKQPYCFKNLEKAVKEINSTIIDKKKISIRSIAKKYGVPRSSLSYHLKHPGHKTSMGPSPVLTTDEEDRLEQWVIVSARKGFPKNKDDILDSVQKFLTDNPRPNPFSENRPGDGWWKAFLKRHTSLSIRSSEGVTKASSCVSEKDVRGWFRDVKAYLDENDLTSVLSHPERIFNADETNFQICTSTGQVLAEKGSKNVYNIERSKAKESITVLFTFSASGAICCPFIVYPYQRLPEKISESIPEDWGIGKSDSGWMTSEVFYEFIANVFYPYLVSQNIEFPVILFVDGHKTHLNYHLSQLCSKLKIELIALYPNATRILQPADVAAFRPLKVGWRKHIRRWQNEHENQSVTKLNFAPILFDVVTNTLRPEILINGFRVCGLSPFDPDAIDYSKCLGGNSAKPLFPKVSSDAMISFSTFSDIIGPTLLNDLTNNAETTETKTVNIEVLRNLLKAFSKKTSISNQVESTVHSFTPQVIEGKLILETSNSIFDVSASVLNKEQFEQDTLSDPITAITEDTDTIEPTVLKITSPSILVKQKPQKENIPCKGDSAKYTFDSKNSLPSTSKSELAYLPKHNSVFGEYLKYPETPMRKGKRKSERQPYAITSKNFKNAVEKKKSDKERIEKEKEEKKQLREQKKIEKGKAIKPNENKPKMTEKYLVNSEEGINDSQSTPTHAKKVTVLSDVQIKDLKVCVMCRCIIVKNGLECSACFKNFHFRCVPEAHKNHIPDDVDAILFLCHQCYNVKSDSDSDSDSLVSTLFKKVNDVKKNLF